jgi:hypothetical protein
VRVVCALRGSRRARRALNVASVAVALVVTALASWQFASAGWPLADASGWLVAAAGVLFLVGYPIKAYGWSRLFAPHERPGSLSLAAAGGAASVTGMALPGRFDDAVRVAVVRRSPGCPACVRTVVLSLFTLGLVDAVAMTPLASTAAALHGHSTAVRVGLSLVAGAGVAAALVLVALPRMAACGRLIRFRLARWLAEHAPSNRETGTAVVFVLASWLVRGAGLFLLLGALGIGLDLPLALVFLCAGAASAALPIAPAGAATQAGAGAAILIASGVGASRALEFAVASQALAIMAGAFVVLSALAWHGGRRLVAAA